MGNLGLQELILLLVIIGMVLPYIFFLITLQNTLKIFSKHNRTIEPGTVWVLLIPLFAGIFLFFVADAIGTGFKREFEQRGVFVEGKPTYSLGITMAIVQCGYYVVNFLFNIPSLTGIIALAILVIWIVYWVQVNQKKNELISLKTNSNLEQGETSIFS